MTAQIESQTETTLIDFLEQTKPSPSWATEKCRWEIVDGDAAREPASDMFTLESQVDAYPATALVDVHSSETWAGESMVPAVRLEVLGETRFTAADARKIAQALLDSADLLDQINSHG